MVTKTLSLDENSLEQIKREMAGESEGLTIVEEGKPLFVVLRAADYRNILDILHNFKQQINRGYYLQTLIKEGKSTEELQELIKRLDESDRRIREDPEGFRRELSEYGQRKFREYCEQHDIDYDSLTDEKVADIIDEVITRVRGE